MSWMWSQLRFFFVYLNKMMRGRIAQSTGLFHLKWFHWKLAWRLSHMSPMCSKAEVWLPGILQKKVFLFHLFMCTVTIKAANSGWFWLNNWRMKTLNGSAGLSLNQGVHFPTIHLFRHSASPEGNANNMGPHLITPSASLCNYRGSLS